MKLWSDPDSDILHCPQCGARRLFLRATGGGLCNIHYWAIWLCPFCNERQPGRLPNGGHAEMDRDAWKAARAAAIRARDAEEADPPPPGVRFEEAVARIRALRDADLLEKLNALAGFGDAAHFAFPTTMQINYAKQVFPPLSASIPLEDQWFDEYAVAFSVSSGRDMAFMPLQPVLVPGPRE